MKKIFIYPLFLLTGAAVASTTFYYDSTGQCSGLFLNPNATSCSQAVTKIIPPTTSGKTFKGYWANGTKVIDKNGNILINGSTAADLFNGSDNSGKVAQIAWQSPGQIQVFSGTVWNDNNTEYWYSCSSVSLVNCNIGERFYLWYRPNCWSFGSFPVNTGYDYVFNSWRTTDKNFWAASSNASWKDCVVPSQNPSCNGSNISTGDSYIDYGCADGFLGKGSQDEGVSSHRVFAFACKLFRGPANNPWVIQVNHPNGHGVVKLDNTVPGKCIYELECDNGYIPSGGKSSAICEGLECKGFFNGYLSSLDLTATCVKNNAPQGGETSGTIGDNSKNGVHPRFFVFVMLHKEPQSR